MDENQVTVKQVGVRYGLILGLIITVLSIILLMMGQGANRMLGWLNWIIFIAAIVMAHNQFKKDGNGFMTYGQGLGLGTLVGTVSFFINSVAMYIYTVFVDDSMIAAVRQVNEEQFQSQNMSQEQIDAAMKFSEIFLKPEIMYSVAFISGIFMCFVLSLIITIFTQKKDPSLTL